jgi:microcystin-dependent protein
MDPFIGSVLLVPYTYLPDGWLPCVGTLLPIEEHEILFNLIGQRMVGMAKIPLPCQTCRTSAPQA